MKTRRTFAALIAVAVGSGLLGACQSGGSDGDSSSPGKPAAIDGTEIGAVDFDVVPGVKQVTITGAEPGTRLALVDDDDQSVGRGSVDQSDESLGEGVVDDDGNLIFRVVPAGDGYEVRAEAGEDEYIASDEFAVLGIDDPADESFYSDQVLENGYQYITTRDGTQLAVNVYMPEGDGPFPTVVEYSGYDPANPDSPEPASQIWSAVGYAVVGVNMRGTGCSGGAFDLFDPSQTADGYDAVEIVAAQDWVQDHEVGMVGISYPGISQLYVASTQPPSLSAITPLSVTDDLYRGTGYPGGIFNNGFAERWLTERVEQAQPPEPKADDPEEAEVGQTWALKRIQEGDEVCIANQELRSQNIDAFKLIEENAFIIPEWVDDRTPWNFVDQIEVPVFLAGAWQDEQTGGHFPDMLDRFSDDIPMKVTLTNGAHIDSLGPQILPRLFEFNEFYVAKRIPEQPAVIQLAGAIFNDIFGGEIGTIPGDRYADETDFDDALERYEAEPTVRIMYENGFGPDSELGAPQPAFDAEFSDWPIPEVEATTYFFGADGTLEGEAPSDDAFDSYVPDPSARPETNLGGTEDSDAWQFAPAWDWRPIVDGKAVAYLSEPLDEDVVMTGTGSVDLFVRSNVPDADLQVTLSEVRPDGQEVYVQNGWLRASHRKLDEEHSTDLAPRHTHLERDAEPMPDDEFVPIRVQIFSFGQVFHEGSQIRVTIEAPGGDKPRWKFAAIPFDDNAQVDIGIGGDQASKVVLPIIPGVEVVGGVPPCPSLRGQPCRAFEPFTNTRG